jgi:hypothetical protein
MGRFIGNQNIPITQIKLVVSVIADLALKSIINANDSRTDVNSLDFTQVGGVGSKKTSGPKLDTGAVGASGTTYAVSGNDFATQVAGDYVISFVPNAKLGITPTRGAGGNRHSVHYNFNIRTTKVITAGWNLFTGEYISTPGVSHDDFVSPNWDGSDARPIDTQAVPGELAYIKTGQIPTQDDYKPRTG